MQSFQDHQLRNPLSDSVRQLARIFACAALIVIVMYRADILSEDGRERFWSILTQASIFFLILSVVIGPFIHLVSSAKWYMLVRTHRMKVGFFRLFAYYMVGQFYNLVLPTSVGGDVVRGYELGRYTGQKIDAMASVFVERYTGIIVLVVLSAFAIVLNLKIFNVPLITISLGLFALALGLISWGVFDRRPFRILQALLAGRSVLMQNIFLKMEQMQDAIDRYKYDKSALTWAFINSFIFYFLAIVNMYITARVFAPHIDFQGIVIATPVIMLIMNIPVSIGNFGLLEFAYTFTFELLGYGPALGLSTALLMRVKSILDGGLGGLLHPFYSTYNRKTVTQSTVLDFKQPQ